MAKQNMIFGEGERYRAHLEAELVKQELLLKGVIADKERTIQRQDEEIKLLRAKCERLELMVVPGLRPTQPGKKVESRQVAPEGETSWIAYLNRYKEDEEKAEKEARKKADGIHEQERAAVHQPAGGNAPRQDVSGARDAQSGTNGSA